MIYKITINNNLYEVEVEEGEANLLKKETVQAPVISAPAAPPPVPVAAEIPAAAANPGAETAPMPGVVLDVKVTKGQKVNEHDLLLVLEAMKMENEIFSSKSGTVAEIYAANGASVNTGDPLILIV